MQWKQTTDFPSHWCTAAWSQLKDIRYESHPFEIRITPICASGTLQDRSDPAEMTRTKVITASTEEWQNKISDFTGGRIKCGLILYLCLPRSPWIIVSRTVMFLYQNVKHKQTEVTSQVEVKPTAVISRFPGKRTRLRLNYPIASPFECFYGYRRPGWSYSPPLPLLPSTAPPLLYSSAAPWEVVSLTVSSGHLIKAVKIITALHTWLCLNTFFHFTFTVTITNIDLNCMYLVDLYTYLEVCTQYKQKT